VIIAVSAMPVYDKGGLVSRLAAEHGLRVVSDPAPTLCQTYGFQTLYEMPMELQRTCRTKLMEEHVEFLEENDDVILEYSAVEWLADWMRWFWPTTPADEWARILDIGRVAAGRYDAIYHLASGPPRDYDGYVWLDAENSRQVDALMRFLYCELGVSASVEVESQ
jgi:hypothetical protein